MNPEDIKNIIESLLKTGEFLATKGFGLALRKVYFYGITDLIIGIPATIIGLFLILTGLIFTTKNWDSNDVDESEGNIALTKLLIGAILLLLGLLVSFTGLDWLINPELGAIQILADILRNTIR